ncbi:Kinesin-like protein [Plasmodiophora brassicae]
MAQDAATVAIVVDSVRAKEPQTDPGNALDGTRSRDPSAPGPRPKSSIYDDSDGDDDDDDEAADGLEAPGGDLSSQVEFYKMAYAEAEQARAIAEATAGAVQRRLRDMTRIANEAQEAMDARYQSRLREIDARRQAEKEAADQHLRQVESQLQDQQDMVALMEIQRQTMQAAISKLESDLRLKNDSCPACDLLRRDLQRLERALVKASERRCETCLQNEVTIEALRKEIADRDRLQALRATTSTASADAVIDVDTDADDDEEGEVAPDDVLGQLSVFKAAFREGEQARAVLEASLQASQTQCLDLQAQAAALQARIDEQKQTIAALDAQRSTTQATTARLSARQVAGGDRACVQCDLLRQRVAELERAAESRCPACIRKEARIDDLTNDLEEMRTRARGLHDNVQRLQADLTAMTERHGECRAKLNEALEANHRLSKVAIVPLAAGGNADDPVGQLVSELQRSEQLAGYAQPLVGIVEQHAALSAMNAQYADELRRLHAQIRVSVDPDTVRHFQKVARRLRRDVNAIGQAMLDMRDTLGGQFVRAVQEHDNLRLAYRTELGERKALSNLVQELRGNIRVYCRVRPPRPDEDNVIERSDDDGNCLIIKKPETGTFRFQFDKVFEGASSQEQVFDEVKGLVQLVPDGYHVSIFAYGQTGSGKTHTMNGTPEDAGVQIRALNYLFECANEESDQISISLLEIYNENIYDLLADGNATDEPLKVAMSASGGTAVSGLSQLVVQSRQQVQAAFKRGSRKRSVARTNMNEHSSRSHLVLSVAFTRTDLGGSICHGRMHMIDLAGSESVGRSGATGERLKEAQAINKSLSALGDVIAAKANKKSHVPFRNSKLTHLLQESLSKDGKTLMIVNCSPSSKDVNESINSLKFATRVRSVELK